MTAHNSKWLHTIIHKHTSPTVLEESENIMHTLCNYLLWNCSSSLYCNISCTWWRWRIGFPIYKSKNRSVCATPVCGNRVWVLTQFYLLAECMEKGGSMEDKNLSITSSGSVFQFKSGRLKAILSLSSWFLSLLYTVNIIPITEL